MKLEYSHQALRYIAWEGAREEGAIVGRKERIQKCASGPTLPSTSHRAPRAHHNHKYNDAARHL